jgi:hypothetical protein
VSLRSGVVPVVLALSLATGLSLVPSTPRAVDTIWAGLSPELRLRVHMHVSELPPFPEDPGPLRDIRDWPKTRIFDGDRYEVSYSQTDYDVVTQIGSPEDIRPGTDYSASYRPSSNGMRARRGPFSRGPSYVWSSAGQILHQGYRVKDGSLVVRDYDPAGRVGQYSYMRSAPKQPWLSCQKPRPEIGIECFDSTGKLIGFRADDEYYWLGVPRTEPEFQRLKREWDPWYALRDSLRKGLKSRDGS